MADESKKETIYLKRGRDRRALGSVMALSHLPSLALSGQRLGGASRSDPPYLIGGKWNVVDMTGSYGHAIVHGFVNRLILNGASGIFVRTFGTFGHIDAKNIGCDIKGHPSWIELNGDVFELDLRDSSIDQLALTRGFGGTGGCPPLEKALAGEVSMNPLSVKYVMSDDPEAWRRALAGASLSIQSGLNLFSRQGEKRRPRQV